MIKVKVRELGPQEPPKSVHIEKIDNGFTISGYSKDGNTKKFVKDLATCPTILARLLGVHGKKSSSELKDMTEVEDTDDDGE